MFRPTPAWGLWFEAFYIYSPFNKLKITMVNTSSTQNPTSSGCSSMFQSVDKIGVKRCHKIAFLGGWFELCPFRPKEQNLPFKRTKPFLAKIGWNCVLLISPLLPTVVVMSSWLPYSTYLYFGFHLLCSMKKLKEHSREICFPPPCCAKKKNKRAFLILIEACWRLFCHFRLNQCICECVCIVNCAFWIVHCILRIGRSLCIMHWREFAFWIVNEHYALVRAENINIGSLLLFFTPTLCLSA